MSFRKAVHRIFWVSVFINAWEARGIDTRPKAMSFRCVLDFRGFWGIWRIEVNFGQGPLLHCWWKWSNLSCTMSVTYPAQGDPAEGEEVIVNGDCGN